MFPHCVFFYLVSGWSAHPDPVWVASSPGQPVLFLCLPLHWKGVSAFLFLALCAFVFLSGVIRVTVHLQSWLDHQLQHWDFVRTFFKICIFTSSERTLTLTSLGLFPPPDLDRFSFLRFSLQWWHLSSSPLFLLSHCLVNLTTIKFSSPFPFAVSFINGFGQLFF